MFLAVIASILALYLKRTLDQERKQDKIEEEITTEKEKDGVGNLHKKYKDMIGWLEIKGTGFSYPVMQTGIEGHHKDDWQYYLYRDVHGEYSFYGTPFLDVRCTTDSDNLIIYGHNINGRRYFGYLQNFREETFFKEHPKFSFTAVGEKEKEYCVVSVLETDKYADYYSFTDYGNEEDYCRMVEKILSHSKFQSEDVLTKNPAKGTYKDVWESISTIYTTLNVVAVSLLCVFFLYGFCRDSCDLHTDLTFDKTIKMFIRLIITSNVLSMALTYMPKFFSWGKSLTQAILGENGLYMVYDFDGAKVYENISSADFGTMTAFLTSILFFLFTVVCGFIVVLTVLNRILKIYMIAPFAGVALSTLAAGGQTAQVGYSYIRTFFGYVFSALLIAVVIAISGSFIDTVSIDTENALVRLLEYCLKMGVIASSVKMSDSVMQKAFSL